MNGHLLRIAVYALAVGCSSSDDEQPILRECPPAPFNGAPERCDLGGKECLYAAPRRLTTAPEACNGLRLRCEDGATMGSMTLVGCKFPFAPVCTVPVVEGAACEQPLRHGTPTNAECLVPENGQDLDSPIIDGRTCACDFPGPIWRCLRGTFRWTPP